MRFVVKLGGAALEDKKILHASGKAIADLVADGNQVAVVHGGGVQLTRTLAQMGKKSEFVSGLRITDAETRDAALMVIAGRVNNSAVAVIGLPLGIPIGTDPIIVTAIEALGASVAKLAPLFTGLQDPPPVALQETGVNTADNPVVTVTFWAVSGPALAMARV